MGKAALAVTELDDERLKALFQGPEGAARQAFWQAATGGASAGDPALELRLAEDILACRGQVPAERLRARRGSMLVRAASALRAGLAGPTGLRRGAAAGDVVERARSIRHAGFFGVEEIDLQYRRFDGTMSPVIRREVFTGCDAVTVLPYDPRRDRVLVIEQMRAGPYARGEADPWQVEPIAGRIDAGETPEDAARREAQEEAGLALTGLAKIAEYYPTNGAVSEYLYAYLAPCDLPDGVAGVHGVAGEAEDIRGHLLSWDEAEARRLRGEFTCGPLLISLLWLAGARAGLRRAAGAET